MYEAQKITLLEILGLGAWLGSVTFLAGVIVFALLLFRLTKGSRGRRIMLTAVESVLRLVASFCIAMGVWFLWPFGFDAMQGFVFLPALFSEVLTICAVYFSMRRSARKK